VRIALVLVTGLLAAALLWPLGTPPISIRGEAREGLVVRQIERHGDWVLPRRQGVIASKPPLFHWVAALAGRALGPSDATVRLPSALAACVMAVATFVAAEGGAPLTPLLAVAVLTATWGFWTSALEARVDMTFAAAVAVALAGALRGILGAGRGARVALWSGIAAAVLTKGPAGAVLPVGVLVLYLAWSRDLAGVRRLWSPPLAGAAAAVTLGWYAAAARAGGAEFVAVQLRKENLDRLVGRGDFTADRARSAFRIPLAFAGALLPWNLALLDAAARRRAGGPLTGTDRFLHAWWIVVLVTFSLAAKQRSVYLLPLYPSIAVLAARAVAARRWPVARWRAAIALAVCVSTAMYAVTLRVRTAAAAHHGLGAVATAMARVLPPDARLVAAPGVPENDVIVLGWLLDRPILRARRPCDGEAAYALFPRARVGAAGGATVLVDDPRAARLVRCPPVASRPLPSVPPAGSSDPRG